MLEKRQLRGARLVWRFGRGALLYLTAVPWGQAAPSPSVFPILSDPVLPTCHIPNGKTLLNFFAAWKYLPYMSQLDLQLWLGRGRRGTWHKYPSHMALVLMTWVPPLDLTQVPQPHGLSPYDLAGRTGTKQLLFCQTPLDKCSTFNNKLCKPNTKQFLASKLDFIFYKKWGKVQVISVLLGKIKNQTRNTWPPVT